MTVINHYELSNLVLQIEFGVPDRKSHLCLDEDEVKLLQIIIEAIEENNQPLLEEIRSIINSDDI